MILSFKPQFIKKDKKLKKGMRLVNGKIHSLRDDPGDRWKPGMLINFVINPRSPDYFEFGKGKCYSWQRVGMTLEDGILVCRIGYHTLSHTELLQLVKNDGFKSYEDFYKWFAPIIIKKGGQYNPKIIHWTSFTYSYSQPVLWASLECKNSLCVARKRPTNGN